jgi:hypothetical protein
MASWLICWVGVGRLVLLLLLLLAGALLLRRATA